MNQPHGSVLVDASSEVRGLFVDAAFRVQVEAYIVYIASSYERDLRKARKIKAAEFNFQFLHHMKWKEELSSVRLDVDFNDIKAWEDIINKLDGLADEANKVLGIEMEIKTIEDF